MIKNNHPYPFLSVLTDVDFGELSYVCPICGEKLVWSSDYSSQDVNPLDDDYTVMCYGCSNCGASAEVTEDLHYLGHNMITFECEKEEQHLYEYYKSNEKE